jgi:hypothetical protein
VSSGIKVIPFEAVERKGLDQNRKERTEPVFVRDPGIHFFNELLSKEYSGDGST